MGDAVWVDQHPYMAQANSKEWLDGLTYIRKLRSDMIVPGRGPALSHRIVDLRETLPGRRFTSLDDLKQVRGISDKVLARLRPYLLLGDDAAAGAAASEPVRIEGAP